MGKSNFLALQQSCITEKNAEKALNIVNIVEIRKVQRTNILNPDWDFQKMGIGGLDNEFSTIFRRAFASRVVPPDLIEKLGIKHCRGMLLYGPPGQHMKQRHSNHPVFLICSVYVRK